ncbi:hypothetical protein BGW38_000923 [Lunasporangiospora selenospora]|uniref:Protein phosphatase inhibitor 2 n=1 Tax=Lunasporangiospora selenospora TaxID=979761 RepID=A0A9P6FV01_9FUNG|nr:hypothetical protein BGW38_000923 [Lunasporangiospora selenospora]
MSQQPSSPPHPHHSPVLSAMPVKGILKRPASSQPLDERAPRLKWDEENLSITEAQKDSTMKIDEPRTPYVHYNPDLDMDDDETFTLDESKKKQDGSSPLTAHRQFNADSDGPSAEWEDSEEEEEEADEDISGRNVAAPESDLGTSPRKSIDHEQFTKMRSEHYNMKEALKIGHELAEQELNRLDSPGPVPPLPAFALLSTKCNSNATSGTNSTGAPAPSSSLSRSQVSATESQGTAGHSTG